MVKMKRLTGTVQEISDVLAADYAAYSQAQNDVDDIVSSIISNVRENGDSALDAYAQKFDGMVPELLEVSRETIAVTCASSYPSWSDGASSACGSRPPR